MNCTAFRAAIAAAVEDRELPPPEVAAHLDSCSDPACQAEWDETVLLDRAVASWRLAQPAIDVADAVLAGWRSLGREPVRPKAVVTRAYGSPAMKPRTAASNAIVAVATAAVLLLIAVLLSPSSDRLVVEQESAAARNPAGDAGLAYVTYAQNAAQIVTDAVVLTLGGGEQMEDPKVAPIGIGWDADWPPLGEVHAALDDLLESLPADPPPS